MKIRFQLMALVLSVLAPLVILSGLTVLQLWDLQRAAYEQRFLERATALRLALDTELNATVRLLRALSASDELDQPDRLPAFVARFDRLLASNPAWAAMGVTDAAGKVMASLTASPGAPALLPDPAIQDQVRAARGPVVSNLAPAGAAGEGGAVTFIAFPVLRQGDFAGVLYIAVSQQGWLEFLKRYPLAQEAMLTLIDTRGAVIARTRNRAEPVAPELGRALQGQTEGTVRVERPDGQRFYSAFSRSQVAGWTLATGVPREAVEQVLTGPTWGAVIGVLLSIVLTLFLAFGIVRRVDGSMTALVAQARSAAGFERLEDDEPLPIEEAETVRQALRETTERLRERAAARETALQREAEARAQAERASVAKDEFLAMLGHELRNPLSAMKSAAALLAMGHAKPEVHERARSVIQRQIGLLTDIVNDLLDVARLNSGKVALNRTVVDLGAAVRHVIEAFDDSRRCEHLKLQSTLAPLCVLADPTRLEQIVTNLLDNACKYTAAGGELRVQVEVQGDDAVLTVQDTGAGIAPDLLPYVFDVFAQGQRTLDRAQGGLGLGLTVVRRLVELHGGSVSADSRGVGHGSTFVLRLPLVHAGVALPGPWASAPRLPPKRICVVEDNADNRELVGTLLRMKGHSVSTAVDGPAALALIRAESPEIALIDIGLPGLDGIELVRRLRAQPLPQRTLLIALTGYGAAEDRQRALAAGFDAFLVKPFGLEDFERTVLQAG